MNNKRPVSRREVLGFGTLALAVSASGFSKFAFSAGKKRTAIVIGSGIAGLSAAYDLQKAGFDVSVMEKWDFVGGRMRDAKIGPFYMPPHARGVLQNTEEIHSLAKEAGIETEFSATGEADAFNINNGVGDYPASLQFASKEVIRIPGFSKNTISQIAVLDKELNAIKQRVGPSLLASGADLDHETVGQFFTRVMGSEAAGQFMDYWVDPFLTAWGWTRNETSCVPVVAWMAHGQGTAVPRGGIGVLTRKLADLVPVTLRTTVQYVSPPDADGRHTVHFISSNLERASVKPDVVVVATEGKYIPEIVQGLDKTQTNFFRSIDTTKDIAVRYVLSANASKDVIGGAYTQTHPDPFKRRVWYWYVMPKGADSPENPPSISIALQRNEIGPWQRSGLSQPDYCMKLLRKVYTGLDESKITGAVVLGDDDLVHMQPGYVKKMADILKEQQRSRRGLYFAGEYMASAHTAAACASGRHTARTIITHWS